MTGQRNTDKIIHKSRRDQRYQPHVQDPYLARGKLPEPTVCSDCGLVFRNGRWQWLAAPSQAHQQRCPACSRIHDRVPAAILALGGEFFAAHREEVMKLVHNAEQKEKAEHPLERIMGIEEQQDAPRTLVQYTGVHLAKGTGAALHHAYQGQFDFEYSDRDGVLHARWER